MKYFFIYDLINNYNYQNLIGIKYWILGIGYMILGIGSYLNLVLTNEIDRSY